MNAAMLRKAAYLKNRLRRGYEPVFSVYAILYLID